MRKPDCRHDNHPDLCPTCQRRRAYVCPPAPRKVSSPRTPGHLARWPKVLAMFDQSIAAVKASR